MRALVAGLIWVACVSLSWAQEVLRIDGAAALQAALAQGVPGATLELAPGRYGRVDLRPGTAPAVLRSADPARPARISQLTVYQVDGLRLEGLVFDYSFDPADEPFVRPFSFGKSRNITLVGNWFDGDLARGRGAPDDGFAFATGINIRDCDAVLLERNRVTRFLRGLVARNVRGLTLRGNEITALRMDGMNLTEVSDVLIEGNHVHSFQRSLASDDHSDMIQFWTTGAKRPSTGITIRGNVLNSGPGAYTQSIFMRNELVDSGQAGPEMLYRDILIEENLILNAHLHGITVGEAAGVTIRRNTLIQNRGSAGDTDWRHLLWAPQISVKPESRAVRIQGNITHVINGFQGQRGWQVSDNLLIQNQGRASGQPGLHYSRVFEGAGEAGPPGALGTWRLIPGGPGDRTGLGAQLLRSARP